MFVVSLVSSPGAGKTALLEQTLTRLHGRYRVAALVGDLATENDAARLARSQAPVRQITTGTVCHLEAAMVAASPRRLGRSPSSISCSSRTSATSSARPRTTWARACGCVLLSVTEGEDKPLKYPTIFNTADVARDHQDRPGRRRWGSTGPRRWRSIQSVRPGMKVLRVSARTGDGMTEYLGLLEAGLAAARGTVAAGGSR